MKEFPPFSPFLVGSGIESNCPRKRDEKLGKRPRGRSPPLSHNADFLRRESSVISVTLRGFGGDMATMERRKMAPVGFNILNPLHKTSRFFQMDTLRLKLCLDDRKLKFAQLVRLLYSREM